MPEILFPASTAPGIELAESGGRLINAYASKAPEGSRSKIVVRRTPGLRSAFQAGASTFRGRLLVDTQLYVANGDKIYLITKAAGVYTVSTLSGTLPGSGPVFMARNMATTPDIQIVHSDGMSKISGGAVSDFSDADLPAPNSISFLDGYFFPTIGDGHVYASGVNAITYAATDVGRAESSPDGLLRSVPYGRDILLMGTASIEAFANAANATGFPFSRASTISVDGGAIGLWGPYAVAGYEEGYAGSVTFVGSDNKVYRLSGYSAQPISNADLEALIAAKVDDRTSIEASVYVDRGRAIFVLSCDDWTWEYSAGVWNERKSIGQHRWCATGGVLAFGEWLVFDIATNQAYRIDPDYAREGDDQLVWEARSTQAHRFPGRAEIKRANFDFLVGVGIADGADPIETDPKVQISWSFDGGVTFGNPILRSLGAQGKRRQQVGVRNLGLTRGLGVQYKLQISDPVDIALYGGAHDIEERLAA
jgi:hypothetical protein